MEHVKSGQKKISLTKDEDKSKSILDLTKQIEFYLHSTLDSNGSSHDGERVKRTYGDKEIRSLKQLINLSLEKIDEIKTFASKAENSTKRKNTRFFIQKISRKAKSCVNLLNCYPANRFVTTKKLLIEVSGLTSKEAEKAEFTTDLAGEIAERLVCIERLLQEEIENKALLDVLGEKVNINGASTVLHESYVSLTQVMKEVSLLLKADAHNKVIVDELRKLLGVAKQLDFINYTKAALILSTSHRKLSSELFHSGGNKKIQEYLTAVTAVIMNLESLTRGNNDASLLDKAEGYLGGIDSDLSDTDIDGVRANTNNHVVEDKSKKVVSENRPNTSITKEVESEEGDKIDNEVLGLFLDEADEIIPLVSSTAYEWMGVSNSKKSLLDIKRGIHTIKGSANLAGVFSVGELCHKLEDILSAFEIKQIDDRENLQKLTVIVIRQIEKIVYAIKKGDSYNVTPELKSCIEHCIEKNIILIDPLLLSLSKSYKDKSGSKEKVRDEKTVTPRKENQPCLLIEKLHDRSETIKNIAARRKLIGERIKQPKVKVDKSILDAISSQANTMVSEMDLARIIVSDYQSRISLLQRASIRMSEIFEEISGEVKRASRPIHSQKDNEFFLEAFSPISFRVNSASEYVDNITAGVEDLSESFDRIMGIIKTQESHSKTVQENCVNSQLVEISNLNPTFRKMVETVSANLKKDVEYELTGGEISLDKNLLEKIGEPIGHIIKNAIDHGIESNKERKHLRKGTGKITISVSTDNRHVSISIKDNGRGINAEEIRKKAIEKGLLEKSERVDKEELFQLLTVSGLTTKSKVTQISGRGVGMDIVRNTIEDMGGKLHIESTKNAGSSFTLILPQSVGTSNVLMCDAGTFTYGIPTTTFHGMEYVKPSSIQSSKKSAHKTIMVKNRKYKILHISEILAIPNAIKNVDKAFIPIILVNMGDDFIAIQVDDVHEVLEVCTTKLPDICGKIPGVQGYTELPSGKTTYILDLKSMLSENLYRDGSDYKIKQTKIKKISIDAKKNALIIDDSSAMRKHAKNILTKNGFSVTLANDGLQGLDKFNEGGFDVVIVDVEMPGISGLELTTGIREGASNNNVPIVMATSRSADTLEKRALSIGVDVFLVKPYDDKVLINACETAISIRDVK
jgi:chemosensory pili system protein ChpA (sensor histidine kinase/response regulator)